MSKTIAFSGYRTKKLPDYIDPIRQQLYDTVIACISDGYDTFLCGMADGFDRMAAEIVIELKESYDIKLIAVIPFDEGHSKSDDYIRIIENADAEVVLSDKFDYNSYYKRNEYMVNNSDKLMTLTRALKYLSLTPQISENGIMTLTIEDVEDYIAGMANNFVAGRTELDFVYEVMLKYGIDITYPVEELIYDNKTIYSVGFGMFIICAADNITNDVAGFIVNYKNENEIDRMGVVFKDKGFGTNDSVKTTVKETLRCAGVEEFITI